MVGYEADFLNVSLPLPQFSPSLDGYVLRKAELQDEIYAHYPHYTVVTNRERRAPIYAALNIDQTSLRNVPRSDDWHIDSRIGADFQLNNDYYRLNPWDRGHLARRAAAAWGPTARAARHASDETFFYSNASLQHENFNRDEWVALEDWALGLELDSTDKLSVFSGPIYGDFARTVTPEGRPTAMVPAAFFKVVCFLDQAGALAVRAFVLTQDVAALANREGRRIFDYQNYQVSVTEIEDRTGLIFPDIIPDTNPLYFSENEEARRDLHISHFPERIEVDSRDEVVTPGTVRTEFQDDEVDVFIAAALVNPAGKERDGEWISIINLSNDTVDLGGWTLSDTKRKPHTLSGKLKPGEAICVKPVSPLQLANTGGVICLFDDQNRRIDRVRYTEEYGKIEGKPIVFAYRDIP